MRNKKLCLVIRIGDLREDNFILGTQVNKLKNDCLLLDINSHISDFS